MGVVWMSIVKTYNAYILIPDCFDGLYYGAVLYQYAGIRPH
jgi:hypothetical protein